ncbi:3-phosphoshikimate 1-carboxyvinyltransferase [Paraglaciecola hydrolytica]|uniref:3-phosphoshikimate 1-carboxyvinyltransferase n=1 Tax=Paraglaciecola hydrolytica TaxID=1799789 RepID=A0A148KLT1_9ALTE|nr:3-phosphoshikimate 1-carboxyvinyltransferase [Paraglaciecola hydrolytica]KXI27231.1 3-phosphoshikimate 1-carboxyvinyltransferase [Paraglaciecola hydrolytica]
METQNSKIKDEVAIKNLLSRMPDAVANSFTDTQLMHLKLAIGARQWGKHKVDFRGTFPVPFVRSKIYYVFLMGRNHRDLSRREQLISALTLALFVTLFITVSVLFGILVLYLLKSALGIDIFKGFSFGIWTWFKGLWT